MSAAWMTHWAFHIVSAKRAPGFIATMMKRGMCRTVTASAIFREILLALSVMYGTIPSPIRAAPNMRAKNVAMHPGALFAETMWKAQCVIHAALIGAIYNAGW